MNFIKNNAAGIFLCLAIAVPSWFLGKLFPIIGGAIISILSGMVVTLFIKDKKSFEKVHFKKDSPMGRCPAWLRNEP